MEERGGFGVILMHIGFLFGAVRGVRRGTSLLINGVCMVKPSIILDYYTLFYSESELLMGNVIYIGLGNDNH